VEGGGPKGETATFALDATQSPKAITFTPEKGDETAPGIYEIKGDTLRLCFTNGPSRPKEFAAPKGSDARLMVLQRVQK
jgi:uncharacterized protein (TIGR03067 family)